MQVSSFSPQYKPQQAPPRKVAAHPRPQFSGGVKRREQALITLSAAGLGILTVLGLTGNLNLSNKERTLEVLTGNKVNIDFLNNIGNWGKTRCWDHRNGGGEEIECDPELLEQTQQQLDSLQHQLQDAQQKSLGAEQQIEQRMQELDDKMQELEALDLGDTGITIKRGNTTHRYLKRGTIDTGGGNDGNRVFGAEGEEYPTIEGE